MRCGWIPGDLNLIAKKPMRDRVFIDTNILIYNYSEEKDKRERALRIIEENQDKDIVISLQIVNEFVNILKKKFQKDHEEIRNALEEIESVFVIWELSLNLIKDSIRVSERYKYSYYDSLVISAALDSGCSILYTEDMQHNQSIDNKLKIINPFKLPLKRTLRQWER